MEKKHYIVHFVKVEECYYKNIFRGLKTCEIRLDDRDYQKGDTIRFLFHKSEGGKRYLDDEYIENYLVSKEHYLITHVLRFPDGLQEGYVALSIKKLKS